MATRPERAESCAREDGLSIAELTLLWRVALRLHACDAVAQAEAVVAESTAGIEPSPALRRALAETLAAAADALRDRERLQDLALCDPLTGLFNRRFMEEELERQLHESRRLGQPMAVAMLDLDRFRDYNEGHGHLAGDLVLRSLAVLLQGFRRGSDVPCRYGGEEFVLIMPAATAAQAAARLDPLRVRLALIGIHHEGRLLEPVTASIGVAECPTNGGTVTALLASADHALYRAKREGRNRICLAGHDGGATAAGISSSESPPR
ncbi:MAG: GGDEF domain-containing protein [Planctomycetota bacterium]